MKLKITVTEQDILQGVRGHIYICPVGLAAFRVFNKKVIVDGGKIYTYDDRNMEIGYQLPKEISNWIADYDNGKVVEPIEFEVDDII
jgi:hypothetical protein